MQNQCAQAADLNGMVFRGVDDQLVAVDAKTGNETWNDFVCDPSRGEFLSAALVAWNGLVLIRARPINGVCS
jgi:outer membrane protein assembly factor BamB